MFIRTGEAFSASGIALPAVNITRASGDTHSFLIADRENYYGVKAYYQDARRATKGEVVIEAANAVAAITKPKLPASKKWKKKEKTVANVIEQTNTNPGELLSLLPSPSNGLLYAASVIGKTAFASTALETI